MFCRLLNFAVWQNASSVSSFNFQFSQFWRISNYFLHKNDFSSKLMEPSIKAVGAPMEVVKTCMDSTETFSFFCNSFHWLPPTSIDFRLLPAKSPYACISYYHELQAVPPWGREGRSFPSLFMKSKPLSYSVSSRNVKIAWILYKKLKNVSCEYDRLNGWNCDEIHLPVEVVTVGFLRICRHSCCDWFPGIRGWCPGVLMRLRLKGCLLYTSPSPRD